MSGEIIPKNIPTLSANLRQWLAEQHLSPQGGQFGAISSQSIDELWELFDFCDQVEMAGRVMQGFFLAEIRARDSENFEAGIREREIAHSSAYRCLDYYILFNSLGDLTAVRRAGQIGAARIRELKPAIGLDGILKLAEGGRVETLDCDAVCAMSKRDIIAWRNERERRRAVEHVARHRLPDAPPPPAKEPIAATTAREEALATLGRMRAETALLQSAITKIPDLAPTDENEVWFRGAAVAAASELRELFRELDIVCKRLATRFGAGLEIDAAEYSPTPAEHALGRRWIEEVHAAATERLRERHQRCRLRGRPATVNGLAAPKRAAQAKRGRPRKTKAR